jgi:hypothetical protein
MAPGASSYRPLVIRAVFTAARAAPRARTRPDRALMSSIGWRGGSTVRQSARSAVKRDDTVNPTGTVIGSPQ